MSVVPKRVVVAGGGVAGLETLIAVRSLAGDRADLVLVAPDDEFVYRCSGSAGCRRCNDLGRSFRGGNDRRPAPGLRAGIQPSLGA